MCEEPVRVGSAGLDRRIRKVRVVDVLAEVVEHLDSNQAELARRRLVAELVVVGPGTWVPTTAFQTGPGHLGLLVLDGLLTRDVLLETPLATELVGRGDLLRPADRDGQDAPIPFDIAWNVLTPARLAILDAAFARAAGNWPSVVEFILRGASNRAHSLAITLAISHLRGVDVRLLVLLWYLADRWGKVLPEGILVPLNLTHQTLARLVGAARPSVTTALRELAEQERVRRMPNRGWMLYGTPPLTLELARKPRRPGAPLEPVIGTAP
ncbi:MAG: Crp/Fnr family transcriptional regulator [Solirubrobacteraceae bacterium]